MKKICTIFLVIIMVLMMTPTVFAATTVGENGGSTGINVAGVYESTGTVATKVSVDIAWTDMLFTYTEGSQGTWDPSTHTYVGAKGGSWSDDATITVTNHSNTDITATLSFESNEDTVTGVFTETSGTEGDNILNLDSADGLTVENAPSASASFGLSGSVTASNEAIGVITVLIEAVDYVAPAEITNVAFYPTDSVIWDASDVRGASYTIKYMTIGRDTVISPAPIVIVTGNNLGTIEEGLEQHLVALLEPNGTVLCQYAVYPGNFTVDLEKGWWRSDSWELDKSELQLTLAYSNDWGETWTEEAYVYFSEIGS